MWAEVQCVNGVYFGLKHQDINSTGVALSQVILTESNSLPFYLLRFCHTVCQHVHCCCNSAYLSKARWLQSVFSGGSIRLCDNYHIYKAAMYVYAPAGIPICHDGVQIYCLQVPYVVHNV